MITNGVKTRTAWQSLAIALLTVFLTLGASWLAVGRDIVTEAEVRRIVTTEAPYVRDRQLLQQGVTGNVQSIIQMRSELNALNIGQAVMTTKLDAILAQLAESTD